MSKDKQATGGDAKPLPLNNLESLSSAAKASAPKGVAEKVDGNVRGKQG
jgi:hypothetical protein